MKLDENKHICLWCGLKNNRILPADFKGRLSTNKCQVCKQSKDGITLKKLKVREDG